MWLMGICTTLTVKPTNPIIIKPRAVALTISRYSFALGASQALQNCIDLGNGYIFLFGSLFICGGGDDDEIDEIDRRKL
jgi:hypothetical protein